MLAELRLAIAFSTSRFFCFFHSLYLWLATGTWSVSTGEDCGFAPQFRTERVRILIWSVNGRGMPYFAMQYQILFHDTMAYGSHHHMTNFKFQNVARETILFETSVNGQRCFDEQAKDIVMLTREAYSLNLAPVWLGQKVGILLSYEEPTRSSVRLCFRVVEQSGQPVCCGYQTMIMMHKDTHELVPAPPFLSQFLNVEAERNLIEPLVTPSFAELARSGSGGVRHIFPESIRRLGKSIANAPGKSAYPKIVDENLREYEFQD